MLAHQCWYHLGLTSTSHAICDIPNNSAFLQCFDCYQHFCTHVVQLSSRIQSTCVTYPAIWTFSGCFDKCTTTLGGKLVYKVTILLQSTSVQCSQFVASMQALESLHCDRMHLTTLQSACYMFFPLTEEAVCIVRIQASSCCTLKDMLVCTGSKSVSPCAENMDMNE
jgi:hypothetical protein